MDQKKTVSNINVEIGYFKAKSNPERGIYKGGVVEPNLKELSVWAIH